MSTNQLMPTSSEDSATNRLSSSQRATNRSQLAAGLQRTQSSGPDTSQEIFVLPRQKSRSRDRRESRMFLVDGQLCWADDLAQNGAGGAGSSAMPAGFMAGKRSSSIGLMFGSSMDLSGYGQSIDSSGGAGSGSEEAISYRIKWCRDNILQLKRQCWPMEKKLQVLRASKLFIKQHQGELKQSKQAKDVIASTSAIFERYWRHFKRELANFLVIITPWEMRIKKIESHFGSVVASYFTFLRWIFWLNLANSLVLCSFVMVPELIENVPDLTGMRKGELGMERSVLLSQAKSQDEVEKLKQPPEFNPTLGEMWEFEGFLKFSPIFYGYYSNVEISRSGFWRNPLAFLLSAMLTYLFCFFSISRKLSQNTKMSRIGGKDDEYTFCWTVFVGWDFMIGNSETAYNKTSSLVMNLKEGILEEKEQTKDRDWSLIMRRVFANVLTILLIVASAYVVTLAVQRSENLPEDASLLQKNELQLVMSGIQFMFPPLFDVIGIIEKYHPRKALSWQLGRILFLDFLNFYTLMFSLFGTVDQMTQQLNEVSGNITLLRKNSTYYNNLFTTTTTTTALPPPSNSTIDNLFGISNSTLNSSFELSNETLSTSTAQNVTNVLNLNSTTISLNGSGSEFIQSTTMASDITTMRLDVNTTTSNTSNGFNATGLITSILLAGSTVTMPPASIQLNTGTTAITTFNTITAIPSSNFQQTTSTTTMSTQTEQQVVSSTFSQTTTVREDEDYPDIQNILGSSQLGSDVKERTRRHSRQRQNRRRFRPQDDQLGERDETILIDPRAQPLTEITQTHQQLAGLPPIRDPYRKLGQNRVQQTSVGSSGRGTIEYNYEDEDDEPLEGRLEVYKTSRSQSTASSQHNIRAQQFITKRPTLKSTSISGQGVARPIGGKGQQIGRVVASSRRPITTAVDLDADTNEDLEPTDGVISSSVLITPMSVDAMGDLSGTSVTKLASGDGQEDTTLAFVEPITQPTDGAATQPSAIFSPISPGEQSAEFPPSTLNNAIEIVASSRAGFGSTNPMALDQSPAPPVAITIDDPSATASSTTNQAMGSQQECNNNFTVDSNMTLASANSTSNLLASSTIKLNDSDPNLERCGEINDFKHQEIVHLNSTLKEKLKNLCWETMFGQEMVKMVVMDLVMTIVSAVSFEFMRACFVRYCNRFFFWDLERGFPGYQDFKIAENVLHLVNNQSTVWMGMFFAPGLPAINTVKLVVLMYVRSWAVLTCNIPHETVFKVSKSNNFYYWILLINLLICILPVAYAVTWIRPSWHCGPFGGECRMYLVVTKLLKQLLPPEANSVFRYVTSPGAVIPILIALILIIYYLASTVSSSKEANKELKAQLKKDKEQESAVPEITNTTEADPANGVQVAESGQTATGEAPAVSSSSKTSGSIQAPSTGTGFLLPPLAAAAATPQTLAGPGPSDPLTKPKSLLMPPPT